MTTVVRQIHFAVKGNRKRAVDGPPQANTVPQGRIPRVTKLMALAIRFEKLLQDGVVGSQSDLAELARVTQPRMTQIMNLLHLAPDIQEEILFLPKVYKGRDPITEREMRQVVKATRWGEQRLRWQQIGARQARGGTAPWYSLQLGPASIENGVRRLQLSSAEVANMG